MLLLNIASTIRILFRVDSCLNYNLVNRFHQSSQQYLDQRWRERHRLSINPNTVGPLTDSKDYVFKDGKITPLGVRQKARLDKQRSYAERIITLVAEIDYAVARHASRLEEEKQRRQQILDSKLKPKGDLLLQNKKDWKNNFVITK